MQTYLDMTASKLFVDCDLGFHFSFREHGTLFRCGFLNSTMACFGTDLGSQLLSQFINHSTFETSLHASGKRKTPPDTRPRPRYRSSSPRKSDPHDAAGGASCWYYDLSIFASILLSMDWCCLPGSPVMDNAGVPRSMS